MKLIPILLLASLLTSCMTQQKATNYFNRHPEQLSKICSGNNASDTVQKDSTSFRQGLPEIDSPVVYVNVSALIDTVFKTAKTDSIRKALMDSFSKHPIMVRAPCPPAVIRVDTFERTHYLQVTNKARENYLLYQRDSTGRELVLSKTNEAHWKEKAKKRETIIFELSGAILFFVLIKLLIGYLKLKGKAIPFL